MELLLNCNGKIPRHSTSSVGKESRRATQACAIPRTLRTSQLYQRAWEQRRQKFLCYTTVSGSARWQMCSSVLFSGKKINAGTVGMEADFRIVCLSVNPATTSYLAILGMFLELSVPHLWNGEYVAYLIGSFKRLNEVIAAKCWIQYIEKSTLSNFYLLHQSGCTLAISEWNLT